MLYLSRLVVASHCLAFIAEVAAAKENPTEIIELRAWGVPSGLNSNLIALTNLKVLEEFQRLHPNIQLVPTTGLVFPGGYRTRVMVPLMQIAGDADKAKGLIREQFSKSEWTKFWSFTMAMSKPILAVNRTWRIYRRIQRLHVRSDNHSQSEDVDADGLAISVPVGGGSGGKIRLHGYCGDSVVPDIRVLPGHHHAGHRRVD